MKAESAPEPTAEPEPKPEPAAEPKPAPKPKPAPAAEPKPAPAPKPEPAPKQATAVKATLIEPDESAPKPDNIVVRRRGRVTTGLSLVGMGLKTLLFGAKDSKKQPGKRRK